jgi:hypothetical protein
MYSKVHASLSSSGVREMFNVGLSVFSPMVTLDSLAVMFAASGLPKVS